MTDETHDDDGQDPDEGAAELFPTGALEGDAVTPQSLIKKGLPTQLVVSLSKAEVPIRGKGLVDPNKCAMYVEDANDVAALIRTEFEALVAKDGAAATALLAELRGSDEPS